MIPAVKIGVSTVRENCQLFRENSVSDPDPYCFSFNFFPYFSSSKPWIRIGSGSVFSLKFWIRIHVKWTLVLTQLVGIVLDGLVVCLWEELVVEDSLREDEAVPLLFPQPDLVRHSGRQQGFSTTHHLPKSKNILLIQGLRFRIRIIFGSWIPIRIKVNIQ